MQVRELEREHLLYPLRYEIIRRAMYEPVKERAKSMGYRINDIRLDNLVKKVLSRARREAPSAKLEEIARSFVSEVLKPEVLACLATVRPDEKCRVILNEVVDKVIARLRTVKDFEIVEEPEKLFVETKNAFIKLFSIVIEHGYSVDEVHKLCRCLSSWSSELGKVCSIALEEAKVRQEEEEVLRRIRSKGVSGKLIAKFVREDRLSM